MSDAPRPRLAFLEGIRAAAALLVLWNHVFAEVFPVDYHVSPPASLSIFSYLLVIGHFSVTVFIALSGYCLMLPHVQRYETGVLDIKRFFARRARRILPTYFIALACCLVLLKLVFTAPAGIHFDSSTHPRTTDIVSHLLLVQNVFGTGNINYVFWSIATEWQIYFLFPLLLLGFKKRSPVWVTIGVLALGYLLHVVTEKTRLSRASVHYIGVFTLGMLAALVSYSPSAWCESIRRRFPFTAASLISLILLVGIMARLGWVASLPQRPYMDLLVSVVAFSVLVLSSRPGTLQKLFSWKPLVFLGTFSYSIYLMHVPFLAMLLKYVVLPLKLGRPETFFLVSVLGPIPIIALCYLFFLFAEKPFLNKK